MTDYARVYERIDALSDVRVPCVFLGMKSLYTSTSDCCGEPSVADWRDDDLKNACVSYANNIFKSRLLPELEFICVSKNDEIQHLGDNLYVCVCGRPPARQLLEILESIHFDPLQVFSPFLPESELLTDVHYACRVKPITQTNPAGNELEDSGNDGESTKTQEETVPVALIGHPNDSGQTIKEVAHKWHRDSDKLLHESFEEAPEIEAERSDGLPFPRWYFEVVVDDLEDAIVEAILRRVQEMNFPGSDKIVSKIASRLEAKKRNQASTGKEVGRPTEEDTSEPSGQQRAGGAAIDSQAATNLDMVTPAAEAAHVATADIELTPINLTDKPAEILVWMQVHNIVDGNRRARREILEGMGIVGDRPKHFSLLSKLGFIVGEGVRKTYITEQGVETAMKLLKDNPDKYQKILDEKTRLESRKTKPSQSK